MWVEQGGDSMGKRMKLVEIRRMRGFSQEYMANKLGCHRMTYAKMEENPQDITMAQANKLADILNVSVNDIIFLYDILQNVE